MAAFPAQLPVRAPIAAPSTAQVYDAWIRDHPGAGPVHSDRWDVSRSDIYAEDRWQPIFAEMRGAAPVNKVIGSPYGDFWNVTSAKAIRHVEAHPALFSSSWTQGGVALAQARDTGEDDFPLPMFIAMDGAAHAARRRTVAPAFSPAQITRLARDIREHTGMVLDALPLGARFDWVDRVSIELTSGTLARLLGVPWEDRRLLAWWSDWASAIELTLIDELYMQRRAAIRDMAAYFGRLWLGRVGSPPSTDLISMMMHSESLSRMSPAEFMGTLVLLVVGGSDTTRNSMSGFVEALSRFPDQRALFESDASVIPNAVHETLRYVTPFAHMRRTAMQDCELFGQSVSAGDKLALWYISANRDEAVFSDPDRLDFTRANARHHLSFGHGIHRCVGARLAELQLRILLEEMHTRRLRPRIAGRVERVRGNFAHGFRRIEVELERF